MPEVRLLGGALRRLLGGKRIEVAAGCVGTLLQELVERAGAELAGLVFESDGATLSRDLRVLVNGRSIQFLDGLATRVEDTDSVAIHFSGIRGFPGG